MAPVGVIVNVKCVMALQGVIGNLSTCTTCLVIVCPLQRASPDILVKLYLLLVSQ